MSCCAACLLPPGNSFPEQCQFTLVVPTQYTCYSAFAAGLNEGIKTTCQNPPVLFNAGRHFQNCGKANARRFELLFCGMVAAQTPLKSSTSERLLPHFHTGEALLFFGCASTLKEHINLAPREVTVNEVPTVADKMKLEHWFPWVLLRCPSGRPPGFYKTPIVQPRNPQMLSTPAAGPIKATLDLNYITASLKGITPAVYWGFTSTSRF